MSSRRPAVVFTFRLPTENVKLKHTTSSDKRIGPPANRWLDPSHVLHASTIRGNAKSTSEQKQASGKLDSFYIGRPCAGDSSKPVPWGPPPSGVVYTYLILVGMSCVCSGPSYASRSPCAGLTLLPLDPSSGAPIGRGARVGAGVVLAAHSRLLLCRRPG